MRNGRTGAAAAPSAKGQPCPVAAARCRAYHENLRDQAKAPAGHRGPHAKAWGGHTAAQSTGGRVWSILHPSARGRSRSSSSPMRQRDDGSGRAGPDQRRDGALTSAAARGLPVPGSIPPAAGAYRIDRTAPGSPCIPPSHGDLASRGRDRRRIAACAMVSAPILFSAPAKHVRQASSPPIVTRNRHRESAPDIRYGAARRTARGGFAGGGIAAAPRASRRRLVRSRPIATAT